MPVHVGPPMGHPQGPPPMPPQGHHMQGYGGPPPTHQYPAPPPPNMQYNKNGGGPPAPMQQPMGGGGYPQQMSDDVEMAQKRKDFETLCQIINAWNANRLDLFALSLPNEVGMTIFFQILKERVCFEKIFPFIFRPLQKSFCELLPSYYYFIFSKFCEINITYIITFFCYVMTDFFDTES